MYQTGHIETSLNTPDSQTTHLVSRVQVSERVILVCDDGKLSANVARMLGVCGFADVAYLQGGIRAWTECGEYLMETTRTGLERRALNSKHREESGLLARAYQSLTPQVLFMGLASSACILAGSIFMLWK